MIKRLFQWRNFILTIGLSLTIISLSYLVPAVNQPSLAQGDLNLKSDIISLQSRISRLEQEVTSLRSLGSRSLNVPAAKPNQPPTPTPAPNTSRTTIVNPPVVDGQVIGRSDPLYSRLATLLIELKEDVKSLDRRLTKIEQANP